MILPWHAMRGRHSKGEAKELNTSTLCPRAQLRGSNSCLWLRKLAKGFILIEGDLL